MVVRFLINTCEMNEIARLARFERCLVPSTKPEQFLHDVRKPKGFCALAPHGVLEVENAMVRSIGRIPTVELSRDSIPFYFGRERMRDWRWGCGVFAAARSYSMRHAVLLYYGKGASRAVKV